MTLNIWLSRDLSRTVVAHPHLGIVQNYYLLRGISLDDGWGGNRESMGIR